MIQRQTWGQIRTYTLGVLALVAGTAVGAGVTGSAASAKTVSILTIGNSFAENALSVLPRIASAAGHRLVAGRANLGGCTLERHWKHMSAYEADPEDPKGSPYGTRSLKELLTQKTWDVVTLQQVSWLSHNPASYEPYISDLHAYVSKHAPQAKIYIHQIWAYRNDDPRYTPKNEGKQPHTHQVMYEQVREANHTYATKLGIGILPSGDAMYRADTDLKWGYQPDTTYDFSQATHPALPNQSHSLHSGWRWKKQKDGSHKLYMDGHHANRNGEYLIGCTWFEVLFGESVVNNSYAPKGMAPEYAQFLRQTAHDAVAALSAK